jgi:branched-chain amino acid transport system substrate-binding protein
MHLIRVVKLAAMAVVVALVVAGCGSGGGDGGSGGDIVIGTSLPMTGPLAGFGQSMKDGYEHAIANYNAQGGVDIGGKKRKITLLVRDNASDPNKATEQARSLILKDRAVALLGAVTPPLNIPLSNVAEQQKVPLVNTLTPVEAWLAGNKSGWKYSWNMFFDEPQMTTLQMAGSDQVPTNKKVALFTDTEDDGVVMGKLWTANAAKQGYTIAYRASFPVGTTDYGSFIKKATDSGAEIVIAQMIPPDAFALWKQMKAAGYQPKTAFCEKCGNVGAWAKALGKTGDGTGAATWWSPAQNRPETQEFVAKFKGKYGDNTDLSDVVATDTAARVLIDAMKAAGSTDPAKVTAAIAKTDKAYPFGDIKFGPDHAYKVPALLAQWTNGEMVVVYPANVAKRKLKAPVSGLG